MREGRASSQGSAGWYSDPERAHTQRYWDGDGWTEERAPIPGEDDLLAATRSAVAPASLRPRAMLAGVGAIIAIVGVFLPLADVEGPVHIARNSLIQHWEGITVLVVALAGFFSASGDAPGRRTSTLLSGLILIGLAVIAGANLSVRFTNALSEEIAGNTSAGAGIWTVGVGGALIVVASLIGLDEGEREPRRRWDKRRWEELMSGRSLDDEEEHSDDDHAD